MLASSKLSPRGVGEVGRVDVVLTIRSKLRELTPRSLLTSDKVAALCASSEPLADVDTLERTLDGRRSRDVTKSHRPLDMSKLAIMGN